MTRLFRVLAFVLAYLLMPGSAEAVESAAHLVANGHFAHAVDDDEHEPHGDEHGCTGVMHACACHCCPAVALLEPVAANLGSAQRRLSSVPAVGHRPSKGHLVRLERPPSR